MNTQRIIKPLKNPEEFDDTKGVIRTRKSKKGRQHNGQQNKGGQTDKQQSTKHYIQNYRSSNMNPAINRG